MPLYTKTGDKGTTSLVGGTRVDKFDARVEAYGTVDELQAQMALLGDMLAERLDDAELQEWLGAIVGELMTVESLLAQEAGVNYVSPLSADSVRRLEQQIDVMTEQLPKINRFTVPGGCVVASQCHVARTVCRRAERRAVYAASLYDVDSSALIYLNRLSDWLYAFGRYLYVRFDVSEKLWNP